MPFTPVNILIIEDNIGDLVLIENCLQRTRIKTTQILHSQTLEQGISTLTLHPVDIVLLDLSLPDSFGDHSYRQIQGQQKDMPVIILSGSKDEEMALDIVRKGAQDYLVKDELQPKILEKTILYSIERKKNQTSLDRSRAQYQLLFDNNPLPMWTYDVETLKFEMVNEAAIKHYGYSLEEFLGMTILDIRPDEEKERARKFNKETRSQTLNKGGEWKHLKRNGEVIRVDITAHRIDFNGKKLKLVVAYDITEKVKAKEELEKSEQVFRSLVESFPNGFITLLDHDLKILYSNGLEYQKLGLNPQTAIGLQFVWPDQFKHQQKKIRSKLMKCLKGETVTFEMTRSDHSYNSIAAPIRLADGFDEKIVVITQNITEKYKTEQHLKLLESVIINSSNGIMIVSYDALDRDTLAIVFANKAQQDITGYGQEELLGKNPRIFQGPDSDPSAIIKVRAAVIDCQHITVDLINYKKDGTPHWINLSIVPIFNKKNRCTHFIGLSQDITEQKMAVLAMQKANEELNEKNRQIHEIAMINSHVIRKPVANIIGAMSLINKDHVLDEEVLQLIGLIEVSVKEMDTVIREIASKTTPS